MLEEGREVAADQTQVVRVAALWPLWRRLRRGLWWWESVLAHVSTITVRGRESCLGVPTWLLRCILTFKVRKSLAYPVDACLFTHALELFLEINKLCLKLGYALLPGQATQVFPVRNAVRDAKRRGSPGGGG